MIGELCRAARLSDAADERNLADLRRGHVHGPRGMHDTAAVCAVLEEMAGVKRKPGAQSEKIQASPCRPGRQPGRDSAPPWRARARRSASRLHCGAEIASAGDHKLPDRPARRFESLERSFGIATPWPTPARVPAASSAALATPAPTCGRTMKAASPISRHLPNAACARLRYRRSAAGTVDRKSSTFRNCGARFAPAARSSAMVPRGISGGGMEMSWRWPRVVGQEPRKRRLIGWTVPDDVVAPVSGPQIVARPGDRVAQHLLARRQAEASASNRSLRRSLGTRARPRAHATPHSRRRATAAARAGLARTSSEGRRRRPGDPRSRGCHQRRCANGAVVLLDPRRIPCRGDSSSPAAPRAAG